MDQKKMDLDDEIIQELDFLMSLDLVSGIDDLEIDLEEAVESEEEL